MKISELKINNLRIQILVAKFYQANKQFCVQKDYGECKESQRYLTRDNRQKKKQKDVRLIL